MTKRLLTLATSGALIGLVGCSTPPPPPDGSTPTDSGIPTDGSNPPDGSTGTERTLTYVINSLTVDETPADEAAPVAGFNLDGLHSSEERTVPMSHPCLKFDSPSRTDQDQNCPVAMVNAMTGRCGSMTASCAPGAGCAGGVDNQLPAILDAIGAAASMQFPMGLRPELSNQVRQNRISLIVRVTGVNDLTNDDSVTVKVYTAFPTFTTGCDMVAADREYSIAADALNTPTDIESAKISFPGRITAGRLTVTAPGMFPLPLPEIMGARISLTLTGAQLRASITETGGTAGNLGGSFNGSQLLTAIQMIAPDFAMQAESIIGGFVDIEVGGICSRRMPPPAMFGNIGVGLAFTLATARVTPMSAASRPAGACGGSSSPADAGGNG
ncbi:MAG: hypothetical protein JNK05_04670 [Myxococcales bacterium]|nr:hypothetical protein [Myxococcales bacterium]